MPNHSKKFKILKHCQSCVKATLMKSHGSANNGGDNRSDDGQGITNGANQKTYKNPRRQWKSTEQCKKPNNVRKTNVSQRNSVSRPPMEKNIYKKNEKHLCIYLWRWRGRKRAQELTLHKWNADAVEGDEFRVWTRNEGKDEKESMKLCVARFKI